ncbi:MAG: FlgD immunoglobulin-like domain containing protein [Rhodothermales bacterium]|nr:FlgD immunoglobulin-like domain containing protein [Rhodothermales bacterium]
MQARLHRHAGLLLLALLGPVFVAPAGQALAQTACENELADAEQAYTFGRFDEAIRLLHRCLDARTATEKERRMAYRLIGLSYLGKDVLSEARESVRRLLELVPDYTPDPDQDPPPFVEMVQDVRREMRREPTRPEPPPPAAEREKRGVRTWLLLGGGAALAGVGAVLLASGGDDPPPEPPRPEPTTLNEQEPNDLPEQAQVLSGTPPITVRGSAELGEGAGYGRLDDASRLIDEFEDLYRVTLTQAGITITLNGLSSDGDIYLIDPNGRIVAQSINAGTSSETINLPGQAPGTYLIAVSISDDAPAQGLPASTAYTLVVNATLSGAGLHAARKAIHAAGGARMAADFRLVAHAGSGDQPLEALIPSWVTSWTAYQDGEDGLVEYDGTDPFYPRPGRGVWTQSPQPFALAAPATPAPLGPAYTLTLRPGWNIIANPFSARVDWSAVQAANGITQPLWRWDGHFAPTDDFGPAQQGEAFYFMNVDGREALEIPHPNTPHPTWEPPPAAALRLSLYREGLLAATARAGFSQAAAVGFDGLDQISPPGYFEAAGLRLVRPPASAHSMPLAAEFKPWPEEGAQFDLMLTAPGKAPVELYIEGLEAFSGYAVHLYDLERSTVYDLHSRTSVTIIPLRTQSRLRLVIGRPSFAQSIRDELIPEPLSVANYPNPFNPVTQITYTLPHPDAAVRLEVFDVAGRRVRVLFDGSQPAGTHQVTWDGTDAAGRPVPSGVYLSRLRAGRLVEVHRMLLVK